MVPRTWNPESSGSSTLALYSGMAQEQETLIIAPIYYLPLGKEAASIVELTD